MTYAMLKIVTCLAVTLVSVTAGPCLLDPLYPYGEKRGDSVLNSGDDGHVFVELDSSYNFWGTNYSSIYVNINGLISFESGINETDPFLLRDLGPHAAVFFENYVLEANNENKILYRQANLAEEPELVALVEQDTGYLGEPLTPDLVFIVTWSQVHGYNESDPNKNNTFQFVMASDGNRTFVISNYGPLSYFCEFYGLLHFADGNGQVAQYPISSSSAMKIISYFSTIAFPGRIVTRVDGSISLPALTPSSCSSCSVDADTGLVNTFDASLNLNVHQNNRKFLVAKLYQGDEEGQLDQCKYMMRVVTDGNARVDWVGFSVGIHPKRLNTYKRNFAFERHVSNQVLARGHGLKRSIRKFPYYEFISDDLQQLSVVVEKTAGGWVVRSPSCQYKMVYNPLDASDQLRLTLSRYYKNKTFGMCQNNNNDGSDDHMICSVPLASGTSSEIADSCSCPVSDKRCNKALRGL